MTMTLAFGDERLPDRFWQKVHPEPNSGCWLWSGSVAPRGYGQFFVSGDKVARCNRVIAAVCGAFLSADLQVCHSCDNPNCCNPEHLWVGTASDNAHDAHRKGRHPPTRRRKTLCKRGHAQTEDNRRRGQCHECKKFRQRVEYLRKEQA